MHSVSSRSRGLGNLSPTRRRQQSIKALISAVVYTMTMWSIDAPAQTAPAVTAELFRPTFDGNPADPPRFRKADVVTAVSRFRLSVSQKARSAPPFRHDPKVPNAPTEPASDKTSPVEQRRLQLEVSINGVPKQLIGDFLLLPDGRMASAHSELVELGLQIEGERAPADIVVLNDLPGVTYQYDERTQRLMISAPNELLAPRHFDLGSASSDFLPARSDYGGVLNYSLLTTTSGWVNRHPFAFSGTSLMLDGRMFTPYGTLAQSGILLAAPSGHVEARRLDTTFSYSNQDALVTSRGGDTISGGLSWTRSIRVGGLQAQRSFSLRPDLVTMPLPSINGSAAVPSTVDLYVNNIKTFTQDVGAGPFSLGNLPIISGSGDARIVIRDSAGHETTMNVPFYASPSLLAKDITSFSLEAGFPRLSYGTASDGYVGSPVASASFRKGIFDWMTVEAHSEIGGGLLNGGVGAVVQTGSIGVASAALAGSRVGDLQGLQSFLSYEAKLFGVTVNAGSQMTFGSYNDLASVTARMQPTISSFLGIVPYAAPLTIYGPSAAPLFASARPPKMLNRLTFGIPAPFDHRSSISASFIQLQDGSGNHSKIVTASWSRDLARNTSVFTTAFADRGDRRNIGVFAGVSIHLSESMSASTTVATGKGGTGVTTDMVKPLEQKPGSLGWSVRDTEGALPYREATVSYRSSNARFRAGVSDDRNGLRGIAEVDGAIAAVGGDVFLANRIDDSFAIVDTGVPNVEVFYENRSMGTTDAQGRLLIPSLRSYQRNKIAIDARSLPVDAEVKVTQDFVVPADRSGVRVKFGINTDARAAIVVFSGPDGKPLPPGAQGQIEGGESFLVGYDGQAYVKNLSHTNVATVSLGDRTCRASFDYVPRRNEQVVISSTVCR